MHPEKPGLVEFGFSNQEVIENPDNIVNLIKRRMGALQNKQDTGPDVIQRQSHIDEVKLLYMDQRRRRDKTRWYTDFSRALLS